MDSLGHAHHQLHEYEPARSFYQQAAKLFRETGNRPEEGMTLDHLDVAAAVGDLAAARPAWQRAVELLDWPGPAGQIDAIRAKLDRLGQG